MNMYKLKNQKITGEVEYTPNAHKLKIKIFLNGKFVYSQLFWNWRKETACYKIAERQFRKDLRFVINKLNKKDYNFAPGWESNVAKIIKETNNGTN